MPRPPSGFRSSQILDSLRRLQFFFNLLPNFLLRQPGILELQHEFLEIFHQIADTEHLLAGIGKAFPRHRRVSPTDAGVEKPDLLVRRQFVERGREREKGFLKSRFDILDGA